MTGTPATAEEHALREQIATAALALRDAMNHIPPQAIGAESAQALDQALRSLRDAEAATEALSVVDDLTIDGALLAQASRTSLLMIRHALALLFAELDAAA